jgi:hypothetical protein
MEPEDTMPCTGSCDLIKLENIPNTRTGRYYLYKIQNKYMYVQCSKRGFISPNDFITSLFKWLISLSDN